MPSLTHHQSHWGSDCSVCGCCCPNGSESKWEKLLTQHVAAPALTPPLATLLDSISFPYWKDQDLALYLQLFPPPALPPRSLAEALGKEEVNHPPPNWLPLSLKYCQLFEVPYVLSLLLSLSFTSPKNTTTKLPLLNWSKDDQKSSSALFIWKIFGSEWNISLESVTWLHYVTDLWTEWYAAGI